MLCFSFDVFDTCLVRRVIAPSEVFRHIGHTLALRAAEPRPDEFADDFVEWRCEAERRVRRRATREEITLADIWLELRPMLALPGLAEAVGPALELETEFSLLIGVAAIRLEIVARRVEGHRIIFVSDTCLPRDFLQRCLRAHHLMEGDEPVYASSEHGLTKRTGNLFRHVLAAERIEPRALRHVGDNPRDDLEVPQSLGIAATLFTASRPQAIEQRLLIGPLSSPQQGVDVAGALRAVRLSAPLAEPAALCARTLVENFLGPFLCVWGHWVLAQAAGDRVERLFFASRDTRLLWPVCQRLSAVAHVRIDCRYLHLSRRALLLPSVTGISARDLGWLRREFEVASLPRLLAKLELAPEHFLPAWQREFPAWRTEDVLSTHEQWQRLWAILQQPEISAQLTNTIRTRRQAAVRYLEKAGLCDPGETGFVDVGWFLTCQAALNRLSEPQRGPRRVRGYFLGLLRGRLGPAEAGPATALFRQEAQDLPVPLRHHWIWRNHLLEHITGIADHGPVQGYSPEGDPLFAGPLSTPEMDRFHAIESEVLRYADRMGESWMAIGRDARAAREFLASLLDDFFRNPAPEMIRCVAGLSISSDQNQRDTTALATPFTWAETLCAWLPRRVVQRRLRRFAGERSWPEASTLATPRVRRFLRRRATLARRVYAQLGWE